MNYPACLFSGLSRCNFLVCLLLFALLCGCASHPMGLSDDEWAQLTPEQKIEAKKEQEQINLEKRKQRIEEERIAQEKEQERRRERRELDVARGMIFEFYPENPYCFGGDKCPSTSGSFYKERRDEVIFSLGKLAEVDKIVFFADDNVGRKFNGRISIYADNELVVENVDITRRGKWEQFLVAKPTRNIVFKSVGGDEVRIHTVKVFGSWAKGKTQYLIVK